MRVIVAGATGAVGSVLTGQLLAAGHQVLGMTRSASGAKALRGEGAEPHVVDLLDRAALLASFEGEQADAVIHQATAISKTPVAHRDLYPTNRLRTEGTSNLVALAARVGAGRLVTQSFLFGYGYHDHGPGPVTEHAPFGGPGPGRFDRHVAAMRTNEELALTTPAIEGIALRYGIFYGYESNTLALLDQAERGKLVAPRRGSIVSMVHLEDAAAAAMAALEHGRAGRAYNIADDQPCTWTSYLQAIAAAVGGRAPMQLPNRLLRISPYLGTLMTRTGLSLDSSRAKQELGWTPRFPTVSDGLRDVARRRQVARP